MENSAGELNLWQQESMDPESEELELRSKVVTFSEFREPLLDEGEAELTAFATLKRKVKPSVKNKIGGVLSVHAKVEINASYTATKH